MISRQLPVHSPLTAAAVMRAAVARRDERPILSAKLLRSGWAESVLTDSGTSALALALKIGFGENDLLPCLLPAYGCFDLVTAALAASVPMRFYDVDPHTLGPDRDSLRRALHSGCSSVVLVHPLGLDVGDSELVQLVRSSGATLIADGAQADGLEISPQEADMVVRSFGRGKGWTGGGGGALLLRETSPLRTSLVEFESSVTDTLRFAVMSGAQWLLGRPTLYRIPASIPALGLGETVFKTPTPPVGMRPASARLALDTLPLLAAERAHRRRVASFYDMLVASTGGWHRPSLRAGSQPGWLRYPVLGFPRERETEEWKQLGIARGYPIPLHRLPQARDSATAAADFPGAEETVAQLWTLPTHSYVSERWQKQIASWLQTHSPTSRP